jgi:hypothetical protein
LSQHSEALASVQCFYMHNCQYLYFSKLYFKPIWNTASYSLRTNMNYNVDHICLYNCIINYLGLISNFTEKNKENHVESKPVLISDLPSVICSSLQKLDHHLRSCSFEEKQHCPKKNDISANNSESSCTTLIFLLAHSLVLFHLTFARVC